MTIEQVAEKYGMKKQDVYQRLRKDEIRNVSKRDGYALDRIRGPGEGEHRLVDPETGLVIENLGNNALVIGKMGDDRVSAFVRYHMAMLEMRQGIDKSRAFHKVASTRISYTKSCQDAALWLSLCYFLYGSNAA